MLEIFLSELPSTIKSILWINNHIDITERSLERAEIFLNSLEYNACENCNIKGLCNYCPCKICNEKTFCTMRCLNYENY